MSKIDSLGYEFSKLDADAVPDGLRRTPLAYKADELRLIDALTIHRVMDRAFKLPTRIKQTDPESLIPTEWAYVLSKVGKGYLYEVFSTDWHSVVRVCALTKADSADMPITLRESGQRLIDQIINLARIESKNPPNPKKEFDKGEVGLYLLHNRFLEFYKAAQHVMLMLQESQTEFLVEWISRTQAELLGEEFKDRPFVELGTSYLAAILFLYAALEALIEILVHAFLKSHMRRTDRDEAEFQKLPIERKILLLPHVCSGFSDDPIDPKAELLDRFRKLRDFRNEMVHGKSSDFLRSVVIVFRGFLYGRPMKSGNPNEWSLPRFKHELTADHVLEVKATVDGIINEVVGRMESKEGDAVRRFVLKEMQIPVWRDEEGTIHLGRLQGGSD